MAIVIESQGREMEIPDAIQDLCQVFLRGLNAALREKLYGVYLYGALAFPEEGPTGDIDFHVILKETLNDREKSELNDLHMTLARDFPPLGAELDGYYILLEDARQTLPPKHQLVADVTDNSWALHREHIRAGRCIVLQGPDPRQVYPATSWVELANALQGELDYVEEHLSDYPAYCVLNLCRLMYSYDTRDVVVSKRASARWAYDAFPEWRPHIEAARKSYDRQATTQDRKLLKSEVRGFFDFACERIRQSPGKQSANQSDLLRSPPPSWGWRLGDGAPSKNTSYTTRKEPIGSAEKNRDRKECADATGSNTST